MDPIEKGNNTGQHQTTLGELISYYYDRFSQIYDSPDLRSLAVGTVIDDILSRSQEQE